MRLLLSPFRRFNRPYCSVAIRPDNLSIGGTNYKTDEWTNVPPRMISLTERKLLHKPAHPLNLLSSTIQSHFESVPLIQFASPVVTTDSNFDALLVPKDHVSRSKSDTYYVNKDHVLRCHTSAHQGDCLRQGHSSFLCIEDVFRRDAIDSTHYPVFHQCEVFKTIDGEKILPQDKQSPRNEDKQSVHSTETVTKAVHLLQQEISSYVRSLLGKRDLEIKWVSAYFPFTHPSFEMEINLNGKWIEVLGAGVVEDAILTRNGVTNGSVAWAAGFGLERLAIIKYGVPDIRLFWSKDSGFLNQFKGLNPFDQMTYKPVSSFPQCINDISFWLPNVEFSPNDFYDLVRNVGGDLVEQVDLIDDFTNKKTGLKSHCYRITYRSHERTLTKEEVNMIHDSIASQSKQIFNVQLR